MAMSKQYILLTISLKNYCPILCFLRGLANSSSNVLCLYTWLRIEVRLSLSSALFCKRKAVNLSGQWRMDCGSQVACT